MTAPREIPAVSGRVTVERETAELALASLRRLEVLIHHSSCGWFASEDDSGCDCLFKDDIECIRHALIASAREAEAGEREGT